MVWGTWLVQTVMEVDFMAKKSLLPGVSFSMKKAVGITGVKRKIAKATGIPTTKSGRQAKLGKLLGIK